eukprot:2139959-Pleurochrysis_carterae.AAC.1
MALLLAAPQGGGARRPEHARSGAASARASAMRVAPPPGVELPAVATSKLAVLKSDAGEAGRRAADAAVLEPLTTLEEQWREWAMPAAAPVPTLARMTAEPG